MQATTVEGTVVTYLKEFKDSAVCVEEVSRLMTQDGWTMENVQLMLLHRSNSFLLNIFAFDIAEFVKSYGGTDTNKVRQVLSDIAMPLGELKARNREHLFLDNPIWSRPMIRPAPNILFWPILPLFHSFCFQIIENLTRRAPGLYERLPRRRAEFLEKYTLRLFPDRFPDARCFAGSQWKNSLTNETGENDLLIIFDSVALVVEEKSGAINPVARRGGDSIKQEIQELIIEAAQQADSFVNLLHSQPGPHAFPSKSGIINNVDASNIKQFVPLTITLERFGPLATQLPQLQAAGLAKRDIAPIPTMSIADLEIALRILTTPFQLLHYLTRRAAFERNRTFVGDELDLIALYLQTGFAEVKLPDPKRPLILTELARQLDPFLMDRTGGKRFPRPERALSHWWRQIFDEFQRRKLHRRYELGCLLLDMPDEEQHVFEKQFCELCSKVKRQKDDAAQVVEAIRSPLKSEVSNAVIVAAAIRSGIYQHRGFVTEDFADRAMRETGTNQAIVILVDVELEHWPYSGIYLLDRCSDL